MIKELVKDYKGLPREIYILFVSRVVNRMGAFVYPLLTLILTDKIGLPKDKAGTFITLLVILSAPGMLIGGKLVDTIGRKKVLVVFNALSAGVFLLCGFWKVDMTMAYILVLAPMFFSFSMAAQDAMVADITTPDNRKQAFSLLYMGNNLGLSIGPIIGGFLYKNYLSIVFIGDAITTLLSMGLVLVYVGETMGRGKTYAKERKLEKEEEGSVVSILLKRRIIIYYALILFFYNLGYSQWGFGLPLYVKDIFGEVGPKYYGFLAAFNGFIVISMTPIVSKLTEKISSLKAMAIGGLFYSISLTMLAFIKTLPLFFLSAGILTIGEIIVIVDSATFVANNSPASHRGRLNSFVMAIYGAGTAAGPVVMGRLMTIYSMNVVWILVALIVLAASAFMKGLEHI
ncbi:MFS transporter [Haloimpatiens sp. FM7330]|uniref:MFS transporter n=1 Tax=Haloimpatiens sp. FM7330 TaxID=3298610 RepID=UPI0036253F6C